MIRRSLLAALGIAVTLAVAAMTARADLVLPEERLNQELVRGDAAEARAGFRALVDDRLGALGRLGSDADPARHATALELAVRALDAWETGEVDRRLRGERTPDDVVTRIASALDVIREHTDAVAAAAARGPEPPDRDVRAAIDRAGKLLLRSVAFLRDTSEASRRPRLLDAAGRHVSAPATVRQFDAGEGGDLRRTFGIQAAPAPERPAAPAAPAAPAVDPALRTLLERYVRAFVAADVDGLRGLFVAGRVPRRTVAREARKFAGWSLADLGPVGTHDIGGGELEVSLPRITLTDAGGARRTTGDRVVVRRMPDGGYRIASMRPRRQRSRAAQ